MWQISYQSHYYNPLNGCHGNQSNCPLDHPAIIHYQTLGSFSMMFRQPASGCKRFSDASNYLATPFCTKLYLSIHEIVQTIHWHWKIHEKTANIDEKSRHHLPNKVLTVPILPKERNWSSRCPGQYIFNSQNKNECMEEVLHFLNLNHSWYTLLPDIDMMGLWILYFEDDH